MQLNEKKIENYESKVHHALEAPEGGWGYMLVIAMAFMFTVTVGPLAAFGIIYGNFLAELGDEAGATTALTCIFNTVVCFMGLIANHLLKTYTFRVVGIVGSVFFSLGNMLTAFTTNLFQITITFGILQGVGFGLMLPAMFSAFNVYFIKRKNSMMGISQTIVAGISMGIPYICSLLMDKYGFQGTVVIISAISLHGVLAMITLQPVEWHMRKVRISSVDQSILEKLPESNLPLPEEMKFLPENLEEIPTDVDKSKITTMWQTILNFLEVDLLKDFSYVNISFGLSLSFLSDIMFLSLLPMFLYNMGYNAANIAFIMTLFMTADLVGRSMLSCITAYVSIKNRYLFFCGSTLMAVFRILFTYTGHNYIWVVFICSVLGLLRCLLQITIPLVLAEYSQTRFVAVFGLYQTICGVVSLTIGPISGLIASLTTDDSYIMHMLTIQLLLCSIPWTLEFMYMKFKSIK